MMDFISKLVFNLGLLVVAGIVLYAISPEIMAGVFQISWLIYGPLVFLILVVYALPNRKQDTEESIVAFSFSDWNSYTPNASRSLSKKPRSCGCASVPIVFANCSSSSRCLASSFCGMAMLSITN